MKIQQAQLKLKKSSLYGGQESSQSGQALVEYLLVLIVSVAIILGILTQFSRSFKDWSENYFGNYLACLLETGELPSLQGQGGANSGICNEEYEAFSLARGRPPKSNPSQGGQEGGSSQKRKRFRASPVAQGEGGSRGSGSSSSVSKRGSPFLASTSSQGGSGTGEASEGSQEEEGENTGDTSTLNVSQIQGIHGRNKGRRIYRSPISLSESEVEERKKNNGRAKVVDKVTLRSQKKKEVRFLASSKKIKKKVEEANLEMSFGDYLRYLIIAIIILLIVIILVSQGYQVKKSME